MPGTMKGVEIIASKLGDSAGITGGAVLARSYHAEGRLAWQPTGPQAEATRALALLAAWRAQRCISFA